MRRPGATTTTTETWTYTSGKYSQANIMLENRPETPLHWLQVKVRGTRSNRAGIGARVRVVSGGVSRIREISGGSGLSQDAMVASFGLGATTSIDRLEIRWPSGFTQVITPVPGVDQAIEVIEADPSGVDLPRTIPAAYRLDPAIPNPFNPSTRIRFELPRAGMVELTIYNVSGRLVRVLRKGPMEAGLHDVVWGGLDERGAQVVSGVYLYRLKAGSYSETHRMTLLK